MKRFPQDPFPPLFVVSSSRIEEGETVGDIDIDGAMEGDSVGASVLQE